jgi:hypothetical protein
MKSTELVQQLSPTGTEDLAASAQWINPLPFQASAIIEKIEMAVKMISYSHNREGSPAPTESSINQLAALNRLKVEIVALLKSH